MLKSVLPLSFIIATRFFGLFIVLPVLSVYALKLDKATPFLVGLLVGIYALTQMLLQVPFGILSDKMGRKKTMFIGLIIFIIGSFICAETNDIYIMLLGRALQGAGAIGAVAVAMISDFISEEKRSKAMALMGVFIGLAFASSLIIAPLLSEKFGLSSLFYLSIALTLLCIVLLYTWVPKESKIIQHNEKSPLKRFLIEKNFALMNLTNFSQKMLMSISFVFIPLMLARFGFALFDTYLYSMIAGFVAMGMAGALGEKKRLAKSMLLLGVVFFAVAYFLFACVPSLSFLSWGGFVFVFAVVLFFVGFNLHEPIMQSCASKFAKAGEKGAALGVFNSFGYAGSFVGGVLGGFVLSEKAYWYLSLSLLALVVFIVFWFILLCFLKNPSDFKNIYLPLSQKLDTNALLKLEGIVEIYENTQHKVIKYDSKLIDEKEIQNKF
ncbi:MFS transporter [Campylobacter sp. MIT 97-5078]|uniref:MFS transporter n=1 Tax=Campylobacter sp. MIT 97-5078 TaxID=1548153 RepID=UPI0005134619|nr:MFS transporter [Campylobacter sp. MIT 97-5078]KGI55727.1 major facilitator transporter [Campylobacter sp. MIT 97-5078]TQR27162.1 MFS transporter [Campylobacter sp. MIT 97-5078]